MFWIVIFGLATALGAVLALLRVAAGRRPTGGDRYHRDQLIAEKRALFGESPGPEDPTWDGVKRTTSAGESGAGLS